MYVLMFMFINMLYKDIVGTFMYIVYLRYPQRSWRVISPVLRWNFNEILRGELSSLPNVSNFGTLFGILIAPAAPLPQEYSLHKGASVLVRYAFCRAHAAFVNNDKKLNISKMPCFWNMFGFPCFEIILRETLNKIFYGSKRQFNVQGFVFIQVHRACML